MFEFALYCFLMMNGVVAFFSILTAIGVILTVGLGVFFIVEGKTVPKKYYQLCAACMFTFLLAVLTPNTKQTAIIFGVPYLINKAHDINLTKVPVKIIDYVNTYLDKELDALLKEKNKTEDKK